MLIYPPQSTSMQCWCGDDDSDLDKHGLSDLCSFDCAGNSHETCGGYLAMSLYEHNGTPDNVIDDAEYLGCFGDSKNRVLSGRSTSSDDMSEEVRQLT